MCRCPRAAITSFSCPRNFEQALQAVHWQAITFCLPWMLLLLLHPSDACLQLAIEQGRIMGLQVGVDEHGFVNHPAPVCPAVAALYLVQARHLFQTQNILKALLEVIWQESIQDGVGAAVGVGERHHEIERSLHRRRGHYGASDGGDVKNVERQPAEHEHRHNDGHHPRHLSLGTLSLRWAHPHSRGFHLVKRKESGLKCPKYRTSVLSKSIQLKLKHTLKNAFFLKQDVTFLFLKTFSFYFTIMCHLCIGQWHKIQLN